MAPRRCSVDGCKSVSGRQQHRGVTFHTFPLNPITRQCWLTNSHICGKVVTKSILICSRHFRRADFQPLKNNKYLLKNGAIPTIFPWGSLPYTEPAQIVQGTLDLAAHLEAAAMGSIDVTTGDTASNEESIVKQILVDAIKSEIKSPIKRSASADVSGFVGEASTSGESKPKIIRKSLDSAVFKNSIKSLTAPPTQFNSVRDLMSSLHPGAQIEAQDFNEIWHSARVVEVDQDEREVFIHFEIAGNSKPIIDEWIPMNSTRLRLSQTVPSTPTPVVSVASIVSSLPVTPKKATITYAVGERCMAKWTDSRKWKATVQTVLDNDLYEVLFDDGYTKRCSFKDMSKIKRQAVVTPSAAAAATAVTSLITSPPSKSSVGRKINPPLPIPKFDLELLNLLPVPKDGEWCCNWVNDTPIGAEGYLEGPDGHRRPTVLVEDWRLPVEWTKHLYQRSSVSGKWDVVLVGPTKKRFRSKNDVKLFLEERGETYNPDIYDFSIHKRRAKDLGLFVFTDDYKDALKQKQIQLAESAKAAEMASVATEQSTVITPLAVAASTLNISNISSEDVFQGFSPPDSQFLPSDVTVPSAEMPATILSTQENQLEEGYVYVGALKVQIINNLFHCPDQQCNKTFRKENHLQIHIKHYHDDLAKLMGVCPKMSDLAYLRTMGQPTEDVVPKNQIPNAQFFEKVYQSDLTSKAQRKSMSSPSGGKAYVTPKTPSSCDDGGTPSLVVTDTDTHIATLEPPDNVIASPPTTQNTDDTLDKKMTQIEEVLNKNDTSFEQTFIMQECIGGYPKPPSTVISSQMDAESLIQTHSVTKPLAAKSGRPRKMAKSLKSKIKINLKITRPYNKPGPKPKNKLKKQLAAANKMLNRTAPAAIRTSSIASPQSLENRSDYDDQSIGSLFSPSPSQSVPSKSNRLKYLQQRSPMEMITPTTSSATIADATAGPVVNATEIDVSSPKYINENGEMIKIVRMRQEEIISCICQYAEEDGLMIQCELCLCWQHGFCHGIDRENQVPEKYVCAICRNPRRGRPSMKYVHDQDWLYDGRLPVATYHDQNAKHTERFDMLKQSHTLTGNLLELKRFMHSLKVKINIAENKDHPKMYLWAKKWEKTSNELCGIEPLNKNRRQSIEIDEANIPQFLDNRINIALAQSAKKIDEVKAEIASPLCATPSNKENVASDTKKSENTPLGSGIVKEEVSTNESKLLSPAEIDSSILAGLLASPGGTNIDLVSSVVGDCKQEQRTPTVTVQTAPSAVNVPQPEAAIDPLKCQVQLLEHIQKQQALAMQRLQTIETQIIGLEAMDEKGYSFDPNEGFSKTKETLAMLLKDLNKMRKLAELNKVEEPPRRVLVQPVNI